MLSIFVASVVTFIFGAVWYTFLFGKKWAELMDFNLASADKYKDMGMVKPMVANFIVNVISASVIYYLFPQLLVLSLGEFVKVMLIIWLGFSFPIYANGAIWERKSWNLVVLNSAFGIIFTIVMSSVIYLMQ